MAPAKKTSGSKSAERQAGSRKTASAKQKPSAARKAAPDKTVAKKAVGKKTVAKKTAAKKTATKKSAAKKSSPTKAASKRSTARKRSSHPAKGTASRRKYSPRASQDVAEELHEMKRGQLHIGRSSKRVTNPKQAIAIGLARARREGARVPPNPNTGR